MLDNLEILHTMGKPFSIGTHDSFLLEKVVKDCNMKGIVEIGTIKGLSDETNTFLAVSEGLSSSTSRTDQIHGQTSRVGRTT